MNAAATLLHALDNTLGIEVSGSDLRKLADAGRVDTAIIDDIRESLRGVAPFLQERFKASRDGREQFFVDRWEAGIRNPRTFESDDGINSQMGMVKTFLLYYPSLVVSVPLLFTTKWLEMPEGKNSIDDAIDTATSTFLREFSFFADMRELVMSGILEIEPGRSLDDNQSILEITYSKSADIAEELLRSLDRSPIELFEDLTELGGMDEPPSIEFGFRDMPAVQLFDDEITVDDHKWVARSIAALYLSQVLSSDALGANYATASKASWRVTEFLSRRGNINTGESTHFAIESASTLSGLRLPGIASLSFKDIVELRSKEDAFVEWNASMSSVLRRFSGMSELPPDLDQQFIEIASEVLLPRTKQLEDKVSSSRSFAKRLSGSAQNMSLRAIGSAAAAQQIMDTDPVKAAIAGVAGGILPEVLSLMRTSDISAERVLLRHYSLLTDR